MNAFCSLSLDPPLVLVGIDRGRAKYRLLTGTPGYAVNVQADQRDVVAHRGDDRFAGLHTVPGRHSVPLIDGAIAHVERDRGPGEQQPCHRIAHVRGLTVQDGEPPLYAEAALLALAKPEWNRALADAPHEEFLSAP